MTQLPNAEVRACNSFTKELYDLNKEENPEVPKPEKE